MQGRACHRGRGRRPGADVTAAGSIESLEVSEEGTGYVGGQIYAVAPAIASEGQFSIGAKVRVTELSMAECQKQCGNDDMCTAMAFDEDAETGEMSCRLYKGKYAYTKVGLALFQPNDFSNLMAGKCADGADSKFIMKDDNGRGTIVMDAGAEEKCMRAAKHEGCNAINMRTNGEGKLVYETLGTCNVESGSEKRSGEAGDSRR